MGIRLAALHLLARTLPSLGNCSGKRLLTLGVQDCYYTYAQVVDFLRKHGIKFEPVEPTEIVLNQGIERGSAETPRHYRYCVHQKTLFRLLGFAADNVYALDINSYEGADLIHDLNVPIDSSLSSSFGVIFDGGTVEHVFSIKDALFNICRMCEVGGTIIHFSPVDSVNHGFINFNVPLLQDYYLANGFEEITLNYVAMPNHPWCVDRYYVLFQAEAFHFSLQPYYSTMLYAVYRKVEEKPLIIPQQSFYRRRWEAPIPSAVDGHEWRAIFDRKIRECLTAYFIPATVIRGVVAMRRGKKILL